LSDEELRQLTELDFDRKVALAATLLDGGEEKIIGVGRYSVLEAAEDHPQQADATFAVADKHQGRGIGTLLLEHLAAYARAKGICEFQADVLGENNRMMRLLATSGFRVERSLESGVFHVSFATEETEQVAEAQLRRERHATAQSMIPVFSPKSVAVVGASRKPGTIGSALMGNLTRCDFKGPIYPVNPKATEIDGLKAYPTVSDIPEPVDLAFIVVPAARVEAAIMDCSRAGVRAVVVITSGFGEASPEGRKMERKLRDLVRASGMRMVGPNCMGVVNTDMEVSLNGTFVPVWPPAGNVGLLSQSGALGYAILDRIHKLNIGLSTFVSVGNKADVSGNDLLSYWAEDPNTKVILLYLESFGNPREFARITPEIARRKPIIAVKSGRSAAGTRAASSHSAALASLDVAVDALFEEAGVIRTDTLEQLLDVAMLLSTQPIPTGPRVGVVTNAGGPGILLADACEAKGMEVPEFTRNTVEALRSFLPFQAGVTNPVDMIASATPEQFTRAIELVGSDPNIDSVVIIYLPPQLHAPEELAAGVADAAGKVPREKPVLTVFMASHGTPPILSKGPRGSIPAYTFPENAAIALSAAARYGRWRKKTSGRIHALDSFAKSAIRAVIDRVLASHHGDIWLDLPDLMTVLRAAGIEFAATERTTLKEAVDVAERMAYPLVAKVHSAEVLHKSDVGGVIQGIRAREEVQAAVDALAWRMNRIGIDLEQVVLQREIRGGIEALVGVTSDPTFGPLVVCGLGGVQVELLKDVSFRLPPVSDLDAADMIGKLRAAQLLDGYRGSPPGDKEALIRVIQQVSALVEIVPEMLELDLNPVKVLEPGRGIVVVDGRMRIGRPSATELRENK